MCGISGIWKLDGTVLERDELIRFNDSLAHRGPDGSQVLILPDGLGLGHNRLSILDVTEGGAQPMKSHDKRYYITYNGEVYNFLELRDELENKGFSFSSESDTEVILAAYSVWGIDAFHRFNGMWAMAIWDSVSEELILCRDRYGIKPLYYMAKSNLFAFASETNAFKHLVGHRRQLDHKHLQIALTDTYALEGLGHTIFEDIYQLLPGHFMKLDKGGRPEQKRWYDIRDSVVEVLPYPEQVSEFKKVFEKSCELRMRSDVPLATALSGGVDSTAVLSMVHHIMQDHDALRVPEDWQRAFVATFDGTDQDERRFAEIAVRNCDAMATYIESPHNDLVQEVLRSTQRLDAITSTPINALKAVYDGMKRAGVTVSLDGHGVDEMLFGYKQMVSDAFEFYKWNGNRDDALSTMQVLVDMFPEEARESKRRIYEADIRSAFQMRGRPLNKIRSIFKSFKGTTSELRPSDLLKNLSDKPYSFDHLNKLDKIVHEDFFIRTLPSLLRNFDKASMMSSVEIRMPFMDHRLVEMSFAMPHGYKLGGGFTKRILRDAMKGIMPEEIRTRTFKIGLAAPTKDWFNGPLKEFVDDTASSDSFNQNGIWTRDIGSEILVSSRDASWTTAQASESWKYLNAHILMQES